MTFVKCLNIEWSRMYLDKKKNTNQKIGLDQQIDGEIRNQVLFLIIMSQMKAPGCIWEITLFTQKQEYIIMHSVVFI